MSDATVMKNLQPQTDRKIRCDATNSLRNPEVYDMTPAIERLAEIEENARPLKKPRIINRTCVTETPIYYPFTRETGITRLLYCITGQALLISEDGKTKFITDNSLIVLPHDQEYDLLLGRGTQNWVTAHWEPESTFVPGTKNVDICLFTLENCSNSFQALTRDIVENLEENIQKENLMLSWLNLVVHESMVGTRSFSLTPRIDGEADNLLELVAAIKQKPELDWNLNAASQFAGYSPFHFSRVFRAHVGIGLPKFVESCRTEVAIDRLTEARDPINSVAEECGFGSSQAMRSAIREFTGFLPIELRGRTGE